MPATGGTGRLVVASPRECTWSATVEAPWLSIISGRSGQGDGVVEFAAAPNPDPAIRRGVVVLNDQRAEIMQSAGSCTISLAESGALFGQSGGEGQVDVRASSALCAWTAASDASWIELRARDGQGSSRLLFGVQPSTGPPRSALITVSGQQFSVTQSEGCTYSVEPSSHSVPAMGGVATVAVTTTAACPWTAASDVPWIAITGPSAASGPGTVTLAVSATTGAARTGSAVVAGHRITVAQAGASSPAPDPVPPAPPPTPPAPSPVCTYTISPESASAPAAGGTGRITVAAGEGCTWTASSRESWLTITAGERGSGNGAVEYRAAPGVGTRRTGTIEIAGHTFTLQQGQACSYSLSPSALDIDDRGGAGSFTVEADGGCTWTASTAVPWITLTAGASGSGSGTVRFDVASNAGAARTGVVTAAGQTFTVRQGGGCSFGVSPGSRNVPVTGGSGTFDVTAAGSCSWTAASEASWLSITAGSTGSGNGTVTFTAAPHSGAQRSGTIMVAGQRVTVTQAGACAFEIAPRDVSVAAAGGSVDVTVSTSAGCPWTASSQVSWLQIAGSTSGSGSGLVRVQVAANSGSARTGTVIIAGQTFTVTQEPAGCDATVTPDRVDAPARGGPTRLTVTAPSHCAWTSESSVPWITVTAGANGRGDGPVLLQIANNTGMPRQGIVTVAGIQVIVRQE